MGAKCDMNTFTGDRFKRVVTVDCRDFDTFIAYFELIAQLLDKLLQLIFPLYVYTYYNKYFVYVSCILSAGLTTVKNKFNRIIVLFCVKIKKIYCNFFVVLETISALNYWYFNIYNYL